MTLASVLAWINAVLALIMAFYAIRCASMVNARARLLRIIYTLFAIIGIYWCVLYTFVALTEPGRFIDSVLFGQIFVRPAFTWTLGLTGAMLAYRWRARTDA